VNRAARRLLICVALCGAGWAHGQSPAAWASLNVNQRNVLAPLERDWTSITPGQQQKWVELANRYAAMPPDEKTRVQQRMADWSRLSPQERTRARLNFQEARPLGREERKQQWEAYRALPPEQRRELAERVRPANGNNGRIEARPDTKSSLVRVPAPTPAQPVRPSVVQRGSGATTNLVSKPPAPPMHHQAGMPKVAATPGFVDAATLLPQRGAQAATVRTPSGGDDPRDKPQDKK
jgi:hypothetical protein